MTSVDPVIKSTAISPKRPRIQKGKTRSPESQHSWLKSSMTVNTQIPAGKLPSYKKRRPMSGVVGHSRATKNSLHTSKAENAISDEHSVGDEMKGAAATAFLID